VAAAFADRARRVDAVPDALCFGAGRAFGFDVACGFGGATARGFGAGRGAVTVLGAVLAVALAPPVAGLEVGATAFDDVPVAGAVGAGLGAGVVDRVGAGASAVGASGVGTVLRAG
jgi:hypothetical protein